MVTFKSEAVVLKLTAPKQRNEEAISLLMVISCYSSADSIF